MTSMMILVLALSIPQAYILINRLTAKVLVVLTSNVPNRADGRQNNIVLDNETSTQNADIEGNQDDEETPLLNHKEKSALWPGILRIWSSSKSPHTSIIGFTKLICRQDLSNSKPFGLAYSPAFLGRIALVLVFSFPSLVVFLMVAGAVISPNLVTGSAASMVLSDHPNCGFWVRDSNITTPSSTDFDYWQGVGASAYVKKCYHRSPGSDGCNIFVTPKLSYHVLSNQTCPFEETLCLGGATSAYTLETGPVSSKALGINSARGHTFKRRTTCSPIKRLASLSNDRNTYFYHYGSTADSGSTWSSPAKMSWDSAGYNVE
jgi:hypothetical protein